MVQKGAANGNLSVKSAYRIEQGILVQANQSSNSGLLKLWSAYVAPKIKLFWWNVVHNILSVRDKLREMALSVDGGCPTYGGSLESTKHLLFACCFSLPVWICLDPNFMQHIDLGIQGELFWLNLVSYQDSIQLIEK